MQETSEAPVCSKRQQQLPSINDCIACAELESQLASRTVEINALQAQVARLSSVLAVGVDTQHAAAPWCTDVPQASRSSMSTARQASCGGEGLHMSSSDDGTFKAPAPQQADMHSTSAAALKTAIMERDAAARRGAALRLLLAESVREAGMLVAALDDARCKLLDTQQQLVAAESRAASHLEDCDALRAALQRVHACAAVAESTQQSTATAAAAQRLDQGPASPERDVQLLKEQLHVSQTAGEALRAELELCSAQLQQTQELMKLRSDCLEYAERRCKSLGVQVWCCTATGCAALGCVTHDGVSLHRPCMH